ncbi:MAG: 4Fe-4S binding protein, partial [Pseudobdellovibrio sp.]
MHTVAHYVTNHIVFLLGLAICSFVIIPIIGRSQQTHEAKKLIDKAVQSGQDEPMTLHPEIDESLCSGCAACTRVCPE